MSMFFRSAVRGLAALAFIICLAPTASADLKVVTKLQMSMNGDFRPDQTATLYYKGDWVRVDAGMKTTLTNSATHKMIEIDHKSKTYTVTDSSQSSSALMLAGLKPTMTVAVTPTTEQKTVLGMQTTKYICEMDMMMTPPMEGSKQVHIRGHMESWATTDIHMSGSAMAAMTSQQDSFLQLLQLGGLDKAKAELSKIKGFPLINKMTMSVDSPSMPAGSVSVEIEYDTLSISQGDLNRALFSVPADYKSTGDAGWHPAGDGGNG